MLMNAEETSRERDFRNNSSFGLCMNAAKTASLNAIEPQCARDIDTVTSQRTPLRSLCKRNWLITAFILWICALLYHVHGALETLLRCQGDLTAFLMRVFQSSHGVLHGSWRSHRDNWRCRCGIAMRTQLRCSIGFT